MKHRNWLLLGLLAMVGAPRTLPAQERQHVEGFASVVFSHGSGNIRQSRDFRGHTRGYPTAGWWADGQMENNIVVWKTAVNLGGCFASFWQGAAAPWPFVGTKLPGTFQNTELLVDIGAPIGPLNVGAGGIHCQQMPKQVGLLGVHAWVQAALFCGPGNIPFVNALEIQFGL